MPLNRKVENDEQALIGKAHGVDTNKDHSQHKFVQRKVVRYEGPIPPAHEFEAYGRVLPDGPERILKMAEQQSLHRQICEKN
jgi:uncharacterized membrane protein